MKQLFCLIFFLSCATPIAANISEAQAAFQYFVEEVKLDETLTHVEQHEKIQEFRNFSVGLSPQVASDLTGLLLQETRTRIIEMLENANVDQEEKNAYLTDYEKVIQNVQTVETARQMLFFVAELKIHRQYVHDFGLALGCPKGQLLRHDLCKLNVDQFEGYARYYRGGRQKEDRPACLAAWEHHQYEEHHLESYSKAGFDFDGFPKERLRNNMLETVADWLAASKQRGGGTVTEYLVHSFPKKHYDPRLLPYLEEALVKAYSLGFPCWNSDVERIFRDLAQFPNDSITSEDILRPSGG